MSVEAMSWVIDHAPHKGDEYVMLLFLADQVGDEHGHFAQPDMDDLARRCRITTEEAIRVFGRLLMRGAVVPTEPTMYRLVFPTEGD